MRSRFVSVEFCDHSRQVTAFRKVMRMRSMIAENEIPFLYGTTRRRLLLAQCLNALGIASLASRIHPRCTFDHSIDSMVL